MAVAGPDRSGTALPDRIYAAAEVLCPGAGTGDAGELLDLLVRDLKRTPAPDHVWLLLACLSMALPEASQVRGALRVLRRGTAAQASVHLLQQALPSSVVVGGGARLRVVTGEVLVLVDHTARFNIPTGIHRVLRAVVPRWQRDHTVLPVAHSPAQLGLRTLAGDEDTRLFNWRPEPQGRDMEANSAHDPAQWDLVIPWRSTLVLGELPATEACPRLAALGELSGNRLTAIGYDCIPVVSSAVLSPGLAGLFVAYLGALAHADVVAAISASAAQEFAGFTAMLPSQGLPGPRVQAVVLPSDMGNALIQTEVPVRRTPAHAEPVVLCVGRLDPRKNQVALLHAAEQLWREGLRFRLVLVAGSSFGPEGRQAVSHLRRQGRHLTLEEAISDDSLRAVYEQARFTVFASLHEGYGLPVAESFALGVPVLTSNYGSTLEIVEDGGGAVLVDPRDDDALREALRRLLTDDALVEQLRAQIAQRPRRSWDDYAAQAWDVLAGPPS